MERATFLDLVAVYWYAFLLGSPARGARTQYFLAILAMYVDFESLSVPLIIGLSITGILMQFWLLHGKPPRSDK